MIQIDMDMPKSCLDCKFYFRTVCPITNESVCDNILEQTLNKNCPLKEVKDNTATWEQIDNEPDTFFTMHQYKCSNCGKIQIAKSKNIKNFRYCSKCGADMRKAKK